MTSICKAMEQIINLKVYGADCPAQQSMMNEVPNSLGILVFFGCSVFAPNLVQII